MATRQPVTVREGNNEVLRFAIAPDDPTDDLSVIAALHLIVKPDVCAEDNDPGVLVLTTSDPTQVTIDTQTSALITATGYLPPLAGSYQRFYRLDALGVTTKRTAVYGPMDVEAM